MMNEDHSNINNKDKIKSNKKNRFKKKLTLKTNKTTFYKNLCDDVEEQNDLAINPRISTSSTASSSTFSSRSSFPWDKTFSNQEKEIIDNIEEIDKNSNLINYEKMTYVKKLTQKFEKLSTRSTNTNLTADHDQHHNLSTPTSPTLTTILALENFFTSNSKNNNKKANKNYFSIKNHQQHKPWTYLNDTTCSRYKKLNTPTTEKMSLNENQDEKEEEEVMEIENDQIVNNNNNFESKNDLIKFTKRSNSNSSNDTNSNRSSCNITTTTTSSSYESCDNNSTTMSDDIEEEKFDQQSQTDGDQQKTQQISNIPGIFIEEIGESSTDNLSFGNDNDPGGDKNNEEVNKNMDLRSDTNKNNFRHSEPIPKPNSDEIINNRRLTSKSLSCYSADSNDDKEDSKSLPSGQLVRSNLSLYQDGDYDEDYKKILPIIEELIRTEETYINNLRIGIENYGKIFSRATNKNLPIGMRGKKWILLGNIEQIYEFHDNEFLPMLFRNQFDIKSLFDEFMKFIEEECFYSYVLYTMNKKQALKLCGDYKKFFKNWQEVVNDKLGVSSFLVQPIQRLTRYPLLLQQIITVCFNHVKNGNKNYKPLVEITCKVEKRLRNLLTTINEAEEINDIEECYDINIYHQGKFKKMSEFTIYDYSLRRNYHSKAFIFDKCLIYTEIRDKRLYFRGYYPCEYIGFTMRPKSFILYFHKPKCQECEFTAEKSIIDTWIELIRDMIGVFAEEEKRRLKEKYSKLSSRGVYRRSSSVSLLGHLNRLSYDSGNGSVFSGMTSVSSTSSISSGSTVTGGIIASSSSLNSQENSPRTTWYADTFDTI